MNWLEKTQRYFVNGLWTVEMVRSAVTKGKLSAEQFSEITGEAFEV